MHYIVLLFSLSFNGGSFLSILINVDINLEICLVDICYNSFVILIFTGNSVCKLSMYRPKFHSFFSICFNVKLEEMSCIEKSRGAYIKMEEKK